MAMYSPPSESSLDFWTDGLRVYLDVRDDYLDDLIEEIGLAQVRDREVSVKGTKLC